MAEIPVSGRVLAWARKFRGLSLEEAAEGIGISAAELEELETEAKRPTLTIFESIAAAYRLPLATLFRRTPPQEPTELPDFRTVEGAPPRNKHDTRALQAWLGHKNIQHTVRYTELAPDRFKDFWR